MLPALDHAVPTPSVEAADGGARFATLAEVEAMISAARTAQETPGSKPTKVTRQVRVSFN